MRMVTDSRMVFQTLVTFSTVAGKRLVIDIRAVTEADKNRGITSLGWIHSNQNIEGRLNKATRCNGLYAVLLSEVLNIKVEK